MTYYYLYRITNTTNGMIYVGVHKTTNINDGYMGSGRALREVYDEFGIDAFRKDILEWFDNAEDMFAREREMVDATFLNRPDVYNVRRGGTGGFDYINASGLSVRNITIDNQRECSRLGAMRYKHLMVTDEEFRNRHRERSIRGGQNSPGFEGKQHNASTIDKMKKSHIGKHVGSKNSQYGTVWMYNEDLRLSKKVQRTDMNDWLLTGWKQGRKMYKD